MHTRGEEADTGAVDARGGRAGICTQSAAQWQSVCERLGSDSCAGLGGDDASRTRSLLALQLEALPSLRAMVFQRGPWALRPVSELETALVDGVSEDESLAVTLVAHSFAGCTDTGLLGQPTNSNVCENAGTGAVSGVAGAPCAALDGPCQRGYFDEARACCDIQYSVEGASCVAGTTAGVCGAAGNCGDTAEYQPTNAYAWSETLPTTTQVRRVGDWYLTTPELAEDGSLVRETLDHAVLRIAYAAEGEDPHTAQNVEERGVIRVPATSNARVTVAALHAASEGVDGVLVHADRPGIRTLLIDRRLGEGETALTVTITRARLSTLGYLGADGTTIPAGLTETVGCAGTTDPNVNAATLASDEVRCTFTENGLVAVEGEAITAAYVAVAGAEFDVRPAGYFEPRREQSMPSDTDPRITVPIIPPINSCSPVSATRSCVRWATSTCPAGNGTQTCQSNGQWGACVVPEVCNARDDNCNGQVDEGGAALCNDGMSCTVDSCANISFGVTACRNTPSAAVCKRGACTQGLCMGTPDSLSPAGVPSWTSPTYASGCSYREFDSHCEAAWDGCACNGRARCEGYYGPVWSGFGGASAGIYGGLAINQNDLDYSFQGCRDRGPVESLTVSGPRVANARDVRNGGCEATNDPCTLEGVCCEPNPAGCRLFHEGGILAAPLDDSAVSRLNDICGHPAVTKSASRTLDSGPSYQCATGIAGQAVIPAGNPLRRFCQPDDNPCTLPPTCSWSSGQEIQCMTQVNTAGPHEGEIIGGYWDNGWQDVRGEPCSGDPWNPPGGLANAYYTSCIRNECNSNGVCVEVPHVEVCENEIAAPSCGGAVTCTVGGTSFVRRRSGVPGTATEGSVFGCGRTTACWLNNSCVAAGTPSPGSCRTCVPSQGDHYFGLAPDATSCGYGFSDPYGSPCEICLAGSCENNPWASFEPDSQCGIN